MKNNLKTILGISAIGLMLVLASILAGCGSSNSPNTITMKNLQYVPKTLTVSVGTTVTWKNTDGVEHSVTSTTGLFDSGLFNPGGSYTYTFNTAGTYNYYCTIHPGMTGTIIVQ
ncbi:MAG: cupredoxin family copper-binding protein [Dehalogenimonas sp.]